MALSEVVSITSLTRVRAILRPQNRAFWCAAAVCISLLAFLSTLQTNVNGSGHPYATDVGEIQNALPRWGLIHRSGYPLYTATGSLFVTVLRLVGIQPAAGASLLSALWGVVTVGLLVALAHELGASGPAAALGALAAALSTSVWVDASLAEVHTLTLVFTVATLIFAMRFGRTGGRRDLLLLALFLTQGVAHQRSVALMAPAVAVLIWPQLRGLWRGLGAAFLVSLLGPLTYLYLPLRVWMGAMWVFGSPGTWDGFWEMVFDNRSDRVFTWPTSLDEWMARAEATVRILADDMLWPLLLLGLVGLVTLAFRGRRRESVGVTLAWVPNVLLTVIIWKGWIGDAQLAAKLPVLALAGVGLALILEWLRQRSRPLGAAAAVALALTLGVWGWHVRPFVLSVTHDYSTDAVIALAEQVAPLPDDRPTVLTLPWGHDYWALTYAQAYRGQLPGLILVDHTADFSEITERGDRLLTPSKTFHVFPVSWWERRLGRLYLTSVAPGIVELSPMLPVTAGDVPATLGFDLGNGLRIRSATLAWNAPDQLLLEIYWEVAQPVAEDYSVAVHLVARDPPQGGEDVLAQADALHPLQGWYPIARWSPGEIVCDHYLIQVPEGCAPVAVRVALYRAASEGGFVNSPWLSLPLPVR